jgi:hypothetical protein
MNSQIFFNFPIERLCIGQMCKVKGSMPIILHETSADLIWALLGVSEIGLIKQQ